MDCQVEGRLSNEINLKDLAEQVGRPTVVVQWLLTQLSFTNKPNALPPTEISGLSPALSHAVPCPLPSILQLLQVPPPLSPPSQPPPVAQPPFPPPPSPPPLPDQPGSYNDATPFPIPISRRTPVPMPVSKPPIKKARVPNHMRIFIEVGHDMTFMRFLSQFEIYSCLPPHLYRTSPPTAGPRHTGPCHIILPGLNAHVTVSLFRFSQISQMLSLFFP